MPRTAEGLSPPARGSHVAATPVFTFVRSIPARAGEPMCPTSIDIMRMVYPRPRGGALNTGTTDGDVYGLSPPARGSHRFCFRHCDSEGSIPARAGEPGQAYLSGCWCGVYPRPRGEALKGQRDENSDLGLSPPARGSRTTPVIVGRYAGSIPARAGEPVRTSHRVTSRQVYPRPRGGAIFNGGLRPEREGLSPPARGSRRIIW